MSRFPQGGNHDSGLAMFRVISALESPAACYSSILPRGRLFYVNPSSRRAAPHVQDEKYCIKILTDWRMKIPHGNLHVSDPSTEKKRCKLPNESSQ